METIHIQNNTTRVVPIGSTNGKGVFIDYTANRESSLEIGSIRVVNKGSSATVTATSGGDEVGITFTASVSTSNIYLLITASNSTGRTEFEYTIKNI